MYTINIYVKYANKEYCLMNYPVKYSEYDVKISNILSILKQSRSFSDISCSLKPANGNIPSFSCFFYVNILKDKIQKFSKYRVFNKKAKGWSEFLPINSYNQQILVNDAIESICFILELDDKINKIQVDKEDKEDKKGGFCCCIRIESKLVSIGTSL